MARPKKSKVNRRGRHEGSVRRTKNGTWEASVSLGTGAEGKRRRITATAATKKEALEKLAELRQQPLAAKSGRITVGAYIRIWLEDKRRSVQYTSYDRYVDWSRHAIKYLGHIRLADLHVAHIRDWYQQMSKDEVTVKSQEGAAIALAMAMKQAKRDKLITDNPVSACPKPKVPRSEITILSEEQVKQLLAETKKCRMAAFFVTAIGTGARFSEILALEWTDVDFEQNAIRFEKTTSEQPLPVHVKESKTSAGIRTVSMSLFVKEALLQHRKQLVSEGFAGNPLVFPNTRGNYHHRGSVRKYYFWPARERAGLSRFKIHDLRHTAATLMLTKSDAKTVSTILGHKDVTTTLNTYVHPTPESEIAAVTAIGDAFRESA